MKKHLFVALLLSALPAAALAAQGAQGPCEADAAKLCKGVPHGGQKMLACLKEHESSLSPACKERVEEDLQHMKGVKGPAAARAAQGAQGPCEADAAKVCKGVPHGGEKMLACLKEHESSLSPACKERVEQDLRHTKVVKGPCHEDVLRLCSGAKRGHERIEACLQQHQAELSPQCQEAMKQAEMRK